MFRGLAHSVGRDSPSFFSGSEGYCARQQAQRQQQSKTFFLDFSSFYD